MDEKQVLISLLTKAYNKTETEIAQMLYDVSADGKAVTLKANATALLYELDAARVNTWKKRNTDSMTQLANEKTAQINAAWEQRIKDGFNIAEDLKGDDLFNKALELHKATATGTGKGKNSAEYIDLESRYNQSQTKIKDLEGRIVKDYIPKTEAERMARLYDADNYANRVLSSLPLIPDEDPLRQQTKMKYFNIELKQRYDDIQRSENGNFYAFKGGKSIENASGHAVELSEIIKEVALGFWPQKKQDPKGNGDPNKIGQTGTGGTGRMAELQAIISDPNKSQAERYAAMKELERLKLEPAK